MELINMFEMEKQSIEQSRKRFYSFDKKSFAEKLTKDITDAIANQVKIPVVSDVHRLAIKENLTTAEAINKIVNNQLTERLAREQGKFTSAIEKMTREFEPVREQVEVLKAELGIQFCYGVKAKGYNDGFQPILQTIEEMETFSELVKYKDNLFAIEIKVGRCAYRKVKVDKEA